MGSILAPGDWVRLATAPEWGPGQVQSVTGRRVTVNFAEAGKQVVHIDQVRLTRLEDPEEGP